MTRLVIAGGDIYTSSETYPKGDLLIEDDKIAAVEPASRLTRLADATVIDASGLLVVPGFIDLQVNGGYGHDFTADPDSIPLVAGRLPETGVTSFLPTVITSPLERYRKALDVVSSPPSTGAHVLGLHLEGPYLNPQRAGAHDKRWIRSPAVADLDAWEPLDRIRLVTLAPEMPGAQALIAHLLRAGVVVSAGHSDATCDQAVGAFDAGVRYVTHLLNAMRPLHHREPGLAGAALTDDRVSVGLIVDGIHLHPAIVKLVWEVMGPDRITLVTDAMAALGQPAGTYRLGDQEIMLNADEGSARLPDGTLAGSVLTMDAALRNLVSFTGCSLSDALRAAASTPASVIGLDANKGRLAPGYDADITLLTPDLRVAGAAIGGTLLYRSPGAASRMTLR